jgi:hypothetical protein
MKKYYITDVDRTMEIEDLIQWYNLPLEEFTSLRISERQKRTDEFWYEIRYIWNKKENTREILERVLFQV